MEGGNASHHSPPAHAWGTGDYYRAGEWPQLLALPLCFDKGTGFAWGIGVGCSEFGVPCQNQAELSMRGGCEVRPLAFVTALASANPLTAPTLFHSIYSFSCPLQCTCSPFLTENIFIVYECFIFKLHILFLLLNLTSFLTIQFLSYSSVSFPSKLHICTLPHTPHPLSALSAACVCRDDWDPLLQDFFKEIPKKLSSVEGKPWKLALTFLLGTHF